MSKKEQLIKMFEDAVNNYCDCIAVEVETRGSRDTEIIINTKDNYPDKLEYYKRAYNEELILNTYDGIKIVSALAFDSYMQFDDIKETLKAQRF